MLLKFTSAPSETLPTHFLSETGSIFGAFKYQASGLLLPSLRGKEISIGALKSTV